METLRRAARLLDAYEDAWRQRMARIEQILDEDPEGKAEA
jgi:hypothetical protein